MKRLFALLVACLVTLPLVAGCGVVRANAATVNGTEISRSDIDDELEEIRDNPGYRQALSIQTVEGSGGRETFDASFAAQVLTLRIYYLLVRQELERRDVEVSRAELRTAREELVAQSGIDPQTGTPDEAAGERVLRRFSASYREEVIRRQAEVAKLTSVLGDVALDEAALRQHYEANLSRYARVCAQHVLVDTREAADAVRAELTAPGADFGAIAAARSQDPSAAQNRGDLGCQSPDSYVPEFAQAVTTQPVGEVGQPVQTQFGFHVIRVSERSTQPFEEVQGQIRQELAGQSNAALNEWLVETLQDADIDIDPAFGSFDREPPDGGPGRVVPPAPPTTVARDDTSPATTAPDGGTPPPTTAP